MSKHIKEFMESVLPTDNWKVQLLINWPIIMGDLKNHVILEKINENSLILGAFNSSWMHELYLLSPVLIATINKHLGQARIKFIRFKLAHITKTKQPKSGSTTNKTLTQPLRLSTKEQTALADITDEELRSALKNFLVRCQQKE